MEGMPYWANTIVGGMRINGDSLIPILTFHHNDVDTSCNSLITFITGSYFLVHNLDPVVTVYTGFNVFNQKCLLQLDR